MSKMFFLFVLVLVLSITTTNAQITGIVKDAIGEKVLKGATVFINKSTIVSVSNDAGEFLLTGIAPGFAEVIVYKPGFRIYKSPVRIQEGKGYKLTLKLSPEKEPKISSPLSGKEKDNNVTLLEKQLLGSSSEAAFCKITNPQALVFYKGGDTLKLQAKTPIAIANRATGYTISFYPDNSNPFVSSLLSSNVFRFDSLTPASTTEAAKWREQRDKNYFGSARHFFSSIAHRQISKQGFTVQRENGSELLQDSIISPAPVMGYTVVKTKGRLRVIYTPATTGAQQVTELNSPDGFAINDNGLLLNEKSVTMTGSMLRDGLAGLLPINFYPASSVDSQLAIAEAIGNLEERIYLQTDKPYYYPGEIAWFKGYVNYRAHELYDTLSKVMYVDLLSAADQKPVLQRLLRIDSGQVNGDFVIPPQLKAGQYVLRAYTNLLRNFGDARMFAKSIRIMMPTDKVDPSGLSLENSSTAGLTLTTDQKSYGLKKPIKLTIGSSNTHAMPMHAVVSVAVTDAIQVAPVSELTTILTGYPFKPLSKGEIPASINYAAERGIGYSGQYLDDRGKKAKASLTIIDGGFDNLMMTETTADGTFSQPNYQFYDSMQVTIIGKNDKGRTDGKIVLKPREAPGKIAVDTIKDIRIIKTQTEQRAASTLDPSSVTVLKEVTVTAGRIRASDFVVKRYGQPTRIFEGSRFGGTDMLTALLIAIPQIKSIPYQDGAVATHIISLGHYDAARMSSPAQPAMEPLIYVNGVYRGGGIVGQSTLATNALAQINPTTIDHVEIIALGSGVRNPVIAMEGGNGLIAIFTKPGSEPSGAAHFWVRGYSRPRNFPSPDYSAGPGSAPDYRSTIYWNPTVKLPASTGKTEIEFYSADLPGNYRIVVEGVTADGAPVRAVKYITVE